jgi:phosphatidylglycerol:prolipoprotein diacylglycerol transferase
MFPCVQVDTMFIGSFVVQPFGMLVLLAGIVGWTLMMRRAHSLGFDMGEFRAACTWAVVMGAVFSHVLDELFYHPEDIARNPLSLLYVWDGLSSFGGFVGAIAGGIAWRYIGWKKRGLFSVPFLRGVPMPMLPAADVVVPCFAIAWIFGRLGCSIVHDHIGAPVPLGTPFAVAFPAVGELPAHVWGPLKVTFGTAPRYDLGLLELLFTIVLSLALIVTWRRTLAVGTRVAVVCLAYAPVRFAMDFLRDSDGDLGDRRHFALTFAQWSCVALFVFGVVVALRVRRATCVRGVLP